MEEALTIDDAFVRQYDKWVTNALIRMGVVGDDTDDYRALVYERLLEHNNYDPTKGKVTTWLNSVVRSVVSNERKKESRSQDIMDQNPVSLESVSGYIGAEDAGDARHQIDQIMRPLPISQRDREIFLKVHLKGMSHEEVGEEYGLSRMAAAKVCSRVMKLAQQSVASIED